MHTTRAKAQPQRSLSPPVFHVLLALGHEIRHGYAIMQRLAADTGGRASLLPGTLYSTIARMLGEGLIEEVPAPSDEGDDPRRRFYRATARGRALARSEAERLERLVDLARRQDLLPEPRP